MNLAFNTILLFVWFIVPALIFRKFYFSGVFSEEYYRSSIPHIIIGSIIPSALIQLIFYLIVICLTNYDIDFELIANLFYTDKSSSIEANILQVREDLSLIIIYHLSLWFFAALCGIASFRLIRWSKLDRKTKMFRFKNEWHYLITGEILDYPGWYGYSDDIELIVVDVLVDVKTTTILYSGFLDHYKLTTEKLGLEYLYLSSVVIRKFQDNSHIINEQSLHELEGDIMIIPVSQILNLNITYLSLEELIENQKEE